MKHHQFVAAITCVALLIPAIALAETDAEIERLLTQVSKDRNHQLPMGNRDSTLVSTFAGPGRHFTYSSIVNTPVSDWTPERTAYAKRIALNNYCTMPDMAAYREFKVTVTWQNMDSKGKHLYDVTVSPQDCR